MSVFADLKYKRKIKLHWQWNSVYVIIMIVKLLSGVMDNIIDAFWLMIWSSDIHNIIMLTNCTEGGRVSLFLSTVTN